jgi:AcrR family transcriptional regulator
MGERKDELLRAAIAYLLEHGVADLSLRPLAEAIGTSARLVIFHFGSKERLLTEVLQEVHSRLRSILSTPPATDSAPVPPMMQFWQRVSARENLPYLRLLYEVHFIALQNPSAFGKAPADMSINWTRWIESRLPPTLRTPEMATLVGAVFDGLTVELLTTGDLLRTTRSLQVFIEILRAAIADGGASTPNAGKTPRRKSRANARSGPSGHGSRGGK